MSVMEGRTQRDTPRCSTVKHRGFLTLHVLLLETTLLRLLPQDREAEDAGVLLFI